MKASPTMYLLNKLNGKFLKDCLTWLEKRFNNLPGKTRKVIAIATGLLVAMTCTQLIIGALLFRTTSIDMPSSIASPRTQSKTKSKGSNDNIIPIGRMENINDSSMYRVVAISSTGDYFISQKQTASQRESLIWTTITTEDLRLIEEQSRFIPISQDSTGNQ